MTDPAAHRAGTTRPYRIYVNEAPGDREGFDAVVSTLAAAQLLVRKHNQQRDVEVVVGIGVHELAEPLQFSAVDAGQSGTTVTWAGEGQGAVVSGGSRVQGWDLHDEQGNIWVADVPAGTTTRQLYVDGTLAPRTRRRLAKDRDERKELGFSYKETTFGYPSEALGDLSTLRNQSQLELVSYGSFTGRISPVESIVGDTMHMAPQAWRNNNFGYDTFQAPYARGAIYLVNAYEFFAHAGEWYLDVDAGKLYYKAEPDEDVTVKDFRIPRLEVLIEISGDYDTKVADLTFSGLQFSHTTWRHPSSQWGYASQQAGTHVVGDYPRPENYLDPDRSVGCQDGCPAFEKTRNEWHQIPAAVRVSAATDVSFINNRFTLLGNVGLGVGMDPGGYSSGIGYGVSRITIRGNEFTELAAAAIVAGGVLPDAHHPSDPRMIVEDITIQDNTIRRACRDYRDNPGMLCTYVTRCTITHNTLSELPYDGIDVGWGWGANDPGGNDYYAKAGLFEYQPIYDTPTTFRDHYIAYNRTFDTKQDMHDGGSIYTLSAGPGTVIERNYISDTRETFGILLDQATRYVDVRENVIRDCSHYIWVNSDARSVAAFNTRDLVIERNWWHGGDIHNVAQDTYNIEVRNNVELNGLEVQDWPAEALRVMAEAGARTRPAAD